LPEMTIFVTYQRQKTMLLAKKRLNFFTGNAIKSSY